MGSYGNILCLKKIMSISFPMFPSTEIAKHQIFLISCQDYRVVIQRTSFMPDLIQVIHSVSCSYDYVWQSVITLSIQFTTTRGIGHCFPPSRKTTPSCYHYNFIDKSFSCCTKKKFHPFTLYSYAWTWKYTVIISVE